MDATASNEGREPTDLPKSDGPIQPAPVTPEISGTPDLPPSETAPEGLDQQLGAQPPRDTDGNQWP